ncbi:unnamed protein product [Closterium sp. Yama58-4]|nr:unnamed protein product [Closterium sp. Yama58-4]
MESQMQVPRVQPYVVVGPQYCAPYETVLVMKDKIFSFRDAKEVRDVNNNLQFRIADKLLSIRDRTTIQNAMGESVCTIVSKLLSLRDTVYLCPGNSTNTDNYLLKARKSILSFKPVLKVFLRGNASDSPDIYLSGSILKHNFKITTNSGILLAEVNQNLLDARKYIFDAQTYFIRIMPNVDMALILALVALADALVLHPYKREFTFYSCANQSNSRIDRALISQSLLSHVEFATHIMPADPISDHSFAVKAAFRMDTRVKLGPGLWRLPAYMIGRPGVRKIIEAVERQVASNRENFELLISRLNADLKSYVKEERKRVKATMTHLQDAVAALKQAWMGNSGDDRLKALLVEKESQLRGYQLARQERLHEMAGMSEAVAGEVASPFLSGKIKARREKTQIKELSAGGVTVTDNKAILGVASQFYRNLFGHDRQQVESGWVPATGRMLSLIARERLTAAWSEKEVKSAFHAMAKNKAPGNDGLPKELFEEHWDVLGKHFMALVESFTETAELPASTKSAVTIRLHKKGGRDAVENYRPITLLSFTYKVLARVVADRINRVLNEVISPEQYGFLPGRRLSDAVGLVAYVIDAAKNEQADWYFLLVDFQKAFDSVSRNYLFLVLEKMGFPSRLAQEAVNRSLGLTGGAQRLAYLGYADDTTLLLQGEDQIAEAEKLLDDFERESGLATNKSKSAVLPLGCNLNKQASKTDGFKRVKADEAERLLGVWVTPAGCCAPTWEKAFARIKEKLRQWEVQHLTTGARAAVINCYISPIIFFQAQVYPPPVDIWGRVLKLTHNFMSGNRATTDKAFILWSKELLYMAREDGGVGVNDPEIALTCLTARRIGLLLTETNELKRDIMLKAADLPLGLDTFVSHVKLLKCWSGKSERWKLACGDFMQSPLAITSPVLSREEAEMERIVFNRHILLNGRTPVGGQKAAEKLWELEAAPTACRATGGGLFGSEGSPPENPGAQRWAADVVEGAERKLAAEEASVREEGAVGGQMGR